jgi:hypothetical protein
MAKTNVTVVFHGRLFNHEWRALLDAGIREAMGSVAEFAVETIKRNLDDVLIENTGAYVSTITAGWEATDMVVTDGTVYGPWLEGVGSRNASTRFKGYWTFRRSTQDIKDNVSEIAGPAIEAAIAEINL